MQAGSEKGARRMGILYTIITTCKLNGINPEDYLKDALRSLAMRTNNADVTDLLPVQWYKNKNAGAAASRGSIFPVSGIYLIRPRPEQYILMVSNNRVVTTTLTELALLQLLATLSTK